MAITFTKNILQRLGRNLRDSVNPSSEDLSMLQEYRLSHKDIVKKVFDIICNEAHTINEEAICTFRIKRIDSIIRKLQRLKGQLELKSMRDIAGCRCIMKSDAEVFKLMNNLKYTPLRLIQEPNIYMGKYKKDTGYGSIHMYVALPEYEKLYVEIQIRTEEQHDWATFVETIDLLYDTKLKEGINTTTEEQYNDFYRMHQILSKLDSHRSKTENIELIRVVIKYNILEKLDTILVSNIANVRHQWAKMMSEIEFPQYFYIGTTENNQPIISAYTSYSDAEQYYYDSFEKSYNKNQVIVCVMNPSYNRICTAYSNYMLVCHKFSHRIHKLFADAIDANIGDETIFNIAFYYRRIVKRLSKHIDIEIQELENSQNVYDDKVIQEWMVDVNVNLEQYQSDFFNFSLVASKLIYLRDSNPIIRFAKRIIYKVIVSVNPNYFIKMTVKQLQPNDRVENI